MNECLSLTLPIPNNASHTIIDSSKLKTFLECPRKFFYEYMLGWRSENPNNHLVFGTSLHLALEHLLLHGYTAENVVSAYLKFETDYRKTSPQELDELFFPKTPDRVFECLAEYCNTYPNDLKRFKVLHTEVAFSVMLSEQFTMTGRMDSILQDNELGGKIVSLDHKSASSFYGWEAQFPLSMQTGLYSHALYCLHGFEQVGGIVYNGLAFLKTKGNRGGKKFDFHRVYCTRSKPQMQTWYVNTLTHLESLKREYENLSESSDSNDVLEAFPLNTTSCGAWGGCKFRDFCDSWKNPLQKCSQPPIGFRKEFWNPLNEPASVRMTLGANTEPLIENGE